MIRDQAVFADIRADWAGVEALRHRLQLSAFATQMGAFSGPFPFALYNAANNLPFIHAFAVLNDTLEQLAREGQFPY